MLIMLLSTASFVDPGAHVLPGDIGRKEGDVWGIS